MKPTYTIMFWVSIIVTGLAILALLFWGLNLGVDFTGGSVMEIEFANERPDTVKLSEVIIAKTDLEVSVSPTGEKGVLIRTRDLTEDEHQVILREIDVMFPGTGGVEKRFDSIGPAIGEELKSKSLQGIIIVLIGVIIYIAIVFRKLSSVLSPWAMGVSAIASMLPTIIIPLGVFAYLGQFHNVQLGAIFVAAILTILGYSVSDTVVVFDRIRENVIRHGRKESFAQLIHQSVMQTLSRSISTGFATILSLAAVAIFGGETLRYFSLALIMGIVLGSYSSIFVASPMLYFFSRKRQNS